VWSLSVDGCASHEQGTLKNKEEKKKKKILKPKKFLTIFNVAYSLFKSVFFDENQLMCDAREH
jgi:hypothetical protein